MFTAVPNVVCAANQVSFLFANKIMSSCSRACAAV